MDAMMGRELLRLDADLDDRAGSAPGTPISAAAVRVGSSAVRDLLQASRDGEVLSFAGGIPPTDVVPRHRLHRVLQDLPVEALQYGETAGEARLRELIAARFLEGTGFHAAEVVVTAGSQQALDLLARALLDPGDVVAIEDPGYIGALQVFRSAGAELLGVRTDEDGLDVDALAAALARGVPVKVCFTVPDGNNPTGTVLAMQRRERLVSLARRYGFVLIEDTAYRPVTAFPPPSLATLDDRVVSIGTVSKLLAPGLRIGWVAGPPEVVAAVERLKQAADLHTSSLSQHLVAELLADDTWLEQHRRHVIAIYEHRRRALTDAAVAHLAEVAHFSPPAAGMFLWLQLRHGTDARHLLARAMQAGIAFVPGAEFAARGTHDRTHASKLRLSIAPVSTGRFDEAMRRLADVASGLADERTR
jgi:2-aminoadipate transaminase